MISKFILPVLTVINTLLLGAMGLVVFMAGDWNREEIEFTVHNIIVNQELMEVSHIRTSTHYPLEVAWLARVIEERTGLIVCQGLGVSTVEYIPDNMFGPVPINVWVGDDDCRDKIESRVVAIIGTWYWTDHVGDTRSFTFRSNPIFPVISKTSADDKPTEKILHPATPEATE